MDLTRWVDALLASPITSGTPRYLEHCVRGRLCAWEIHATGSTRPSEVPAWWREALALAGAASSLAATDEWWRPWPDEAALDLAWNRVLGGLGWVRSELRWSTPSLPPDARALCRAVDESLAEPERYPHPEALEAELEQLLRCTEMAIARADPGAPRRLAGLLHAARRASRGLKSPVTLHLPLSEVRTVGEILRQRSLAPPSRVHDAYARVVFYGAQLRDRCAATFRAPST